MLLSCPLPIRSANSLSIISRLFWAAAQCTVLFQATFVGGSVGCRVDQVQLGTGPNSTCVRCAVCPHGMEPSIPCGGLGQVLECRPCKPGTYSTAYDKHECQLCSVCDEKRVVLKNCTATSNSECGGCRRGFYQHDLVNDCFECSPCCGDGKDDCPAECRNVQGRQCGKRHSSCPAVPNQVTHAPTTPPTEPTPTSERTSRHSIPLEESHAGKREPTEAPITEIVLGSLLSVVVLVVGIGFACVYKRRGRPKTSDEESGTSAKISEPVIQGPLGGKGLSEDWKIHISELSRACIEILFVKNISSRFEPSEQTEKRGDLTILRLIVISMRSHAYLLA